MPETGTDGPEANELGVGELEAGEQELSGSEDVEPEGGEDIPEAKEPEGLVSALGMKKGVTYVVESSVVCSKVVGSRGNSKLSSGTLNMGDQIMRVGRGVLGIPGRDYPASWFMRGGQKAVLVQVINSSGSEDTDTVQLRIVQDRGGMTFAKEVVAAEQGK